MNLGEHAFTDGLDALGASLREMAQRVAKLERFAAEQSAAKLSRDGSLSMTGDLDMDGNDVVGWDVDAPFSTITAATNFDVTGSVYRWGSVAGVTVLVTRLTSNVGANTTVVGTFAAGGRGSFTGHTQTLNMRSTSTSALNDSLCWIDVSTGEVTIDWPATWDVGVSMLFNAVVLFGD